MIENKYRTYKDFLIDNTRGFNYKNVLAINKKTYQGLKRFLKSWGTCANFTGMNRRSLYYVGTYLRGFYYSIKVKKINQDFYLVLAKY